MPKITQTYDLEINPERFLNACSPAELFDIDRLIQTPRFQNKISAMMGDIKEEHAGAVNKPLLELFEPNEKPPYDSWDFINEDSQ